MGRSPPSHLLFQIPTFPLAISVINTKKLLFAILLAKSPYTQ